MTEYEERIPFREFIGRALRDAYPHAQEWALEEATDFMVADVSASLQRGSGIISREHAIEVSRHLESLLNEGGASGASESEPRGSGPDDHGRTVVLPEETASPYRAQQEGIVIQHESGEGH